MTNFHVGQKVVCVDVSRRQGASQCYLVKGNIYTISFIGELRDGETAVCVEEDPNPPVIPGFGDWLASRFRPLVSKSTETGMAVLREILDRETVKPRQKEKQ